MNTGWEYGLPYMLLTRFVNTVSTMRTLERPPVINVTIGRRLYATTTGYMTYRTGEWSLGEWGGDVSRSIDRSAVALGFATARKQGNYSVELQVLLFGDWIPKYQKSDANIWMVDWHYRFSHCAGIHSQIA